MLIVLAATKGILIVEFINQQRAAGRSFFRAILYASEERLSPIMMTGITTATGTVPSILSSGAGAETRMLIGVVVQVGVLSAIIFTLYVVAVAYSFLARNTGIPGPAVDG